MKTRPAKPQPRLLPALLLLAVLAAGVFFGVRGLNRVRQNVEDLATERGRYAAAAAAEAAFLQSLSLDNGALAFRLAEQGEAYIQPYYACISAAALFKTGDPGCIKAARDYLDWHFAHLNIKAPDQNGLYYTIYDFYADTEDGRVVAETTKQTYDSVDSYAATFLSALLAFYESTGDADYLLARFDAVAGVIGAIEACVQENGLTVARPDYPVCYLMDNCEVYAGLSDAAGLLANVYAKAKDPAVVERAYALFDLVTVLSKNLLAALEAHMWNAAGAHYEVAFQGEGRYADFNWVNLYPDAAAQLFCIIHGVTESGGSRAKALFSQFSRYQSWQEMGYLATGESAFYWGSIPYCAVLMGDHSGFDRYLTLYTKNVAEQGYPYPIFNADSAWVLMAAQRAADGLSEEMDRVDPLGLFHR